jgi:hypothetical protein
MPSIADNLVESLMLKPRCDAADVKGLTVEQRAALHVFLNEVLAAYHRACEKVPEQAVRFIVERRIKKIIG